MTLWRKSASGFRGRRDDLGKCRKCGRGTHLERGLCRGCRKAAGLQDKPSFGYVPMTKSL